MYTPTQFHFDNRDPVEIPPSTEWMRFIHKVNELAGEDRIFGGPDFCDNYIESYPEAVVVWQQRPKPVNDKKNSACIIVPITQSANDLFRRAEAELNLTYGSTNDGYGEPEDDDR